MAQRHTIESVFRAVDQITGPLRKMSRSVGQAADRMARKLAKVNRVTDKIGAGLAKVTRIAAVTAAAVTAGFGHIIGVGAEFEQVLVDAGVRLGGIRRGTVAFDELGAAAVAMSSKTEFGAKDAAQALFFMGTASESAAVAMGTLDLFADSATAGKVSLARAADIASDSIGTLGLALDENNNKLGDQEKIAAYAKTIDLMTGAAAKANLNLEQVFGTTRKAGKAFTDAGQDAATLFSAMQVISSTIKDTEAGTALKGVINRIFAITGASLKAMESLKDAAGKPIKLSIDGKIRPVVDILDDMNVALDRLSQIKRKQKLQQLFGLFEGTGSQLLSQVSQLRKGAVELRAITGITEKLATVGRDTASGAFKTLSSTIEAIEIGIFAIIRDDVVKIVEATTDWAKVNKDAFGEAVTTALAFMKDNFDDIVRIAPRMAKFVAVLWTLNKVLIAISVVMSVVATMTTITAGTLGLIVLAVVAVIVALGLLVFFWDDIQEAAVSAIETIVEIWEWMAGEFAKTDIGQTLIEAWGAVSEFFSEMWDDIVDIFSVGLDKVDDVITDLKQLANSFTGIQLFDDPETAGPRIEAIAGARGLNETVTELADAGRASRLRGVNETLGEFDLRDPATPAVDVAPERLSSEPPPPPIDDDDTRISSGPVDTQSEILQRTVTESRERVQVDVNVRSKDGVVESVSKRGGKGNGVRVTSSGDL